MEFPIDQQRLLNAWQSLHFEERLLGGSDATKTALLRRLLTQAQYATAARVLTPEAAHLMIFPELLEKYVAALDGEISDNGTSIISEVENQLCGHQNEISSWKSTLNSAAAFQSTRVKSFMQESKAASNCQLFPDDRREECMEVGMPNAPHHMTEAANRVAGGRAGSLGSCHRDPIAASFWNMSSSSSALSRNGATRNSTDNSDSVWKSCSFVDEERETKEKRTKRRRGDEEEVVGPDDGCVARSTFKTAKEQMVIDHVRKYGVSKGAVCATAYGVNKRSLGTRRGPSGKFIPPIIENRDDSDDGGSLVRAAGASKQAVEATQTVDDRLKNIEPKMVELITNEIMDHGPQLSWDDIAGLEFAKKTIKEIVIWPMLRPDIFTGLRAPPRGLLLFGPPGTGKTLIGKCIASQSKSTFFSISASSLTSKWVGEGEKMVRALFAVARVHQPAVIFIDEIDSLLTQRSDGEHESSRRIKTEFLVQLDGANTAEDDRILVVGATNRPHEIDEAARRRFVKRLYVPLPESAARWQIVSALLSRQCHQVTDAELERICEMSRGYSGADTTNLCREAALGPIRSIDVADIESISAEQVRPIVFADFEAAFRQVRPSVCDSDLLTYVNWNKAYGSWAI